MLDPMHPEVDARVAHRLLATVLSASLLASTALAAVAARVG